MRIVLSMTQGTAWAKRPSAGKNSVDGGRAETSLVLGLVAGQGMKLTLAGMVVGLPFAFILTTLSEARIYEVSPTGPLIDTAVGAFLLLVAFVACLVPAWRATRVDPWGALRTQ
jgi:ABC-type antimicrobial peptide transport system permease subunit